VRLVRFTSSVGMVPVSWFESVSWDTAHRESITTLSCYTSKPIATSISATAKTHFQSYENPKTWDGSVVLVPLGTIHWVGCELPFESTAHHGVGYHIELLQDEPDINHH
jgi:hypothetical protein